LYDSNSIILATFLGSPLAGGWLMALNYRRLGQRGTFRTCIIFSVLGTIALFAVAALLPNKIPGAPIAIASIFAMGAIAKLQSSELDEHTRVRGGQIASRWKAAGVGLTSMIFILAVVFGWALLSSPLTSSKLTFNGVEEIYYRDDATKADAQKLGEWLQKSGFFSGNKPKTVLLSKTANVTVVSFVVSESAANTPATIDAFRKFGQQMEAAGFDQPVIVRLVDDQLKLLREIK